ncbi:carboxyl transferase domain-containing protein [Quadrisphaera sp. DSM 44207]|uniref:carboxyl transferase domain-containing protein n=1 Tax=Quadrisphaera sp. DSM 44207 TaxID=1881057 RepID=UPI000886D6F7|nr:carboxyl transferase domain-containing protein [Quadrisphaera sp. DSM 44207]SDQ88020.1 acetyl-CoA carboxylase carboxyl transferase subunit beta [Quadrisphaera sp. DSM 44207]
MSAGARDLLELVVDPGTLRSWDVPPQQPPASPEYRAALERAAQRSGADEAVLTGEGLVHGRRVAVAASEFAFLGGSIGVAAAERLVGAVERATAEGLPLLVAPASGGTRMQEGTVAFLQMVKVSAAVAAHRAAGLPYLVHLRHPTTGGVFASWGSLGHVTVAEPGALIGFLGPRVYEALHGEPFPEGVQRAENLVRHGLVDAVVPPEQVRDVAARALGILLAPPVPAPAPRPGDVLDAGGSGQGLPDVPAWTSVERSRDPERPDVRALLRSAAADVLPLQGTGAGEAEPGLLLALARFGGASCVLLGQDRVGQTTRTRLGPAALRAARRGMNLARELRLPLVTVIDTPGAALSVEAEEGGLAGEIARCLAELITLPAPTLAVLLGSGAGGAALALLPADRVVAAQHGWLSPLPPEGASAIVHRDVDHAPQMAAQQGVRSVDLVRAGLVDAVVPERPDAAAEPEEFCARLGRVLEAELVALRGREPGERTTARLQRYRRIGR